MVDKSPSTVDHYISQLALRYEELRRQAGQASLELRAAVFAVRSHGDQKYGTQPYITHLYAVRQVLKEHHIEGDVAVAAWLHDVLEDTQTTRTQLEDVFGGSITSLVWAVTGEGASRTSRNEHVYQKISNWPKAAPLKLADRIANVTACLANSQSQLLSMYQKEHPGFRNAISKYCDPAMWLKLELLIN